MKTWVIEYTLEKWYRVEIEAEGVLEAERKFWAGEYQAKSEKLFGQEINSDITIYKRSADNGEK